MKSFMAVTFFAHMRLRNGAALVRLTAWHDTFFELGMGLELQCGIKVNVSFCTVSNYVC